MLPLSYPLRPPPVRGALLLGLLATLGACSTTSRLPSSNVTLVDGEATPETRALFANLRQLAPDHVLFGHQDDLAYGVMWKRAASWRP